MRRCSKNYEQQNQKPMTLHMKPNRAEEKEEPKNVKEENAKKQNAKEQNAKEKNAKEQNANDEENKFKKLNY